MKILPIVALILISMLSGSVFAAKPTEFYSSVDEAIENDQRVNRIDRRLTRQNFIKQGCSTNIIYYISIPISDATEYLSATADCTYYLPQEGIGFETTYATVKFDILFNKDNAEFRVGDTIDVSYKTIY